MGFGVTKGLEMREAKRNAPSTVPCPRCARANRASAPECAWCHAALPSKAAPRVVSPSVRGEFDDLFGELETLARGDPAAPVRYQCPECGRLVDAEASRCRCGAIFEDPSDVAGYECPLCGARVSAEATRCRCGAVFAD